MRQWHPLGPEPALEGDYEVQCACCGRLRWRSSVYDHHGEWWLCKDRHECMLSAYKYQGRC